MTSYGAIDAVKAAVQGRVERRHDQARDHGDHAGDGEGIRQVKHELEQIEHHAVGGHIRHCIQQVAQRHPQQLVIFCDSGERLQRVAALICLGTQGAFVFLGAERHGPCGQDAEQCGDDAECRPARLTFGARTSEHETESGHDRYHDNGAAVIANRTGERTERSIYAAFVRVGGDGGNHAPVGDVTHRIEHVEDDEHHDKQHDEPGLVHVDQPEQTGVDHDEQHGGDQAADELPRAEPAEAGVGVVHQVTQ